MSVPRRKERRRRKMKKGITNKKKCNGNATFEMSCVCVDITFVSKESKCGTESNVQFWVSTYFGPTFGMGESQQPVHNVKLMNCMWHEHTIACKFASFSNILTAPDMTSCCIRAISNFATYLQTIS